MYNNIATDIYGYQRHACGSLRRSFHPVLGDLADAEFVYVDITSILIECLTAMMYCAGPIYFTAVNALIERLHDYTSQATRYIIRDYHSITCTWCDPY